MDQQRRRIRLGCSWTCHGRADWQAHVCCPHPHLVEAISCTFAFLNFGLSPWDCMPHACFSSRVFGLHPRTAAGRPPSCSCTDETIILAAAFQADAKCEVGRIVLGGWLLGVEADPATAKWFCVELAPDQVPWLFKEDGSSQWASSSAELLATYMACVAFAPDICLSECALPATITAGTDNRSNPQALEKGSSMKWPLMGIMMQFASYLASCGGRIKLQWRPREENIEADDLTNSRFDRFDLSRRVDVSFGDLPMSIFDSLQDAQQSSPNSRRPRNFTRKRLFRLPRSRSSRRRPRGSLPLLSSLTPRLRMGGFVWLVMSPQVEGLTRRQLELGSQPPSLEKSGLRCTVPISRFFWMLFLRMNFDCDSRC